MARCAVKNCDIVNITLSTLQTTSPIGSDAKLPLHTKRGKTVKIDHEYLKGLLEAFEASGEPQTDIFKLQSLGFDYQTQEFLFHMRLLKDRNLIARTDGSYGFGFSEAADGGGSWGALPLRLTAGGHDFLEAIRNKEVWNTVKTGFKDASIGTLVDVSKRLLDGFLQKKIDNILGS